MAAVSAEAYLVVVNAQNMVRDACNLMYGDLTDFHGICEKMEELEALLLTFTEAEA